MPYFRLTKCQDLDNQDGFSTDSNCVKPGDDEEQLILRRSRRLKTLPLMISCCKTDMCFYKFPFAVERFWNGLPLSISSSLSLATFRIHLFNLLLIRQNIEPQIQQ